jgi:acetyl/propionyl-CoA carboxylase alpha subunit
MVRALGEYDVRGIGTTIGLCRWLLGTPSFQAGEFDTTSVDRLVDEYRTASGGRDAELEELAAVAGALHAHHAATAATAAPRVAVRSQPASLWERQARLEGLR